MKNRRIIAVGLTVLLCLTGCSREAAPIPETTEQRMQLANPYFTVDTEEEMEELASFAVTLPSALPDWVDEVIYRTIPGELIEVIYTDWENEIRVRIAEGSEDISGIYDSDIGDEKDLTVGENTVHLKGTTGADGTFTVLSGIWNTPQGRTYSVTSTEGVAEEILLPILTEIR